MTESEYRLDIVAKARAYLGTNWFKYGRGRHEGVDCGGIGFCVGREVGAMDPTWDVTDYLYAVAGGIWGPWAGCTRVPQEQKAPGDILLLERETGSGIPWFCGFLAEVNGELTWIGQAPGEEVYEELLSFILRGGGRCGVVHRLDWPPANASELVQPTPETGITDPEVITP